MEDMMKQGMDMMGKMMGKGQENKEGSGAPGGMDGMMKQGMGMMGKMTGQGGMGGMMDMCKNMTQAVAKSAELASYATEEVKGLFEDWLQQVNQEVLVAIAQSGGTINLDEIAAHLSISPSSARYLVGSMFQKGLLDLGTVHVVDSPSPSASTTPSGEATPAQQDGKDE